MTCFDLMKTGIPDIIIGRHDGNIEVYTMIQHDEVTNEFKPPVNKFSYVRTSIVDAFRFFWMNYIDNKVHYCLLEL